MAESTGRRRQGADDAKPAGERAPTKRVVLRRERVIVVPEGVSLADLDGKNAEAVRRALGIKGGKAHAQVPAEAWVVVGEFEGDSKERAIEAHAGKPNTPDAKPGAYKAPTVTAWAGGRLYEKPPEPKVEVRALD